MYHTYANSYVLCTLISLVSTTFASLYPTYPFSATVYHAGQLGNISWTDDGSYPRLDDLRQLRIDLVYSDNGSIAANVAKDVNPTARMYTITIPEITSSSLDKYMLAFTSVYCQFSAYTADFSIISDFSASPSASATSITSTNASRLTALYATLVLPTTTVVSQLDSLAGAPATSTVFAGTLGFGAAGAFPSSTSPAFSGNSDTSGSDSDSGQPAAGTGEDASGNSPLRGSQRSTAISVGLSRRRKTSRRQAVDLESLKFWTLFICFPFTIGVTMAM